MLLDEKGAVLETQQQQKFDNIFKIEKELTKGKSYFFCISLEEQTNFTLDTLQMSLHTKVSAAIKKLPIEKGYPFLVSICEQLATKESKTYFKGEFSSVYRVV